MLLSYSYMRCLHIRYTTFAPDCQPTVGGSEPAIHGEIHVWGSMTECEKIVQPSEQIAEWAEVEVQILVFQAEDLLQLFHPRLQLLEGGPELFDLLVG